MSGKKDRETSIQPFKQELFYYDEGDKNYKPLVTDGTVPVRIVGEDGVEGVGFQSVGGKTTGRETKIQTPKQEIFYYDDVEKKYKPLIQNGAIPVYIVGGAVADESEDIDGGTF
mgnify:CR=1 FL=1